MLAPIEHPPQPTASGDATVVTVVLAEDNARFRDGIVRALSRCTGVRVVQAVSDGREALAAAVRHRPDVLVLDDRMPGLTGLQVAEQLSAGERQMTTRIVLLTASDDPRLRAKAHAVGIVSVIDKGLSRRQICTAIETAGR